MIYLVLELRKKIDFRKSWEEDNVDFFHRYSQTKENVVIVTMDMGWALFLQ
jgi:hypothetical protein